MRRLTHLSLVSSSQFYKYLSLFSTKLVLAVPSQVPRSPLAVPSRSPPGWLIFFPVEHILKKFAARQGKKRGAARAALLIPLGIMNILKRHSGPEKTTHSRAAKQFSQGKSVDNCNQITYEKSSRRVLAILTARIFVGDPCALHAEPFNKFHLSVFDGFCISFSFIFESFFCRLQPNCSSPFLSPMGSPPTFLLRNVIRRRTRGPSPDCF